MSDNYEQQQELTNYTTEKVPSRKRKIGKLATIVGGLSLLASSGCASQYERNHAFDRSEPVYHVESLFNLGKREPKWTQRSGPMDEIMTWYGEPNRPSLTGGNATYFRPGNYVMMIPRFFTRGIEWLTIDNISPMNWNKDHPVEYFLKAPVKFIGKVFGVTDRVLAGVGDNALGSSTTRAFTPGAYDIEHGKNENKKIAHRAYDFGKFALIVGGGAAALSQDGGSSSSGGSGGGSQPSGPFVPPNLGPGPQNEGR